MTPTLCGARTKRGTPCQRAPIKGGSVCYRHGGGSPQAKAKAAQRLALAKAHKYLQQLGEDVPHRDSFEALQDVGNQASLLLDLLRGVVSRLDTVSSDGGAGVGEQIRGEVQAYLSAMTRAESVHGRILALKLEERRIHIDEQRERLMADALLAAVKVLGLSQQQHDAATREIIKVLKANDPGGVIDVEPKRQRYLNA